MLLDEKGAAQQQNAANPLPSVNNQWTFSQTNQEKGDCGREEKILIGTDLKTDSNFNSHEPTQTSCSYLTVKNGQMGNFGLSRSIFEKSPVQISFIIPYGFIFSHIARLLNDETLWHHSAVSWPLTAARLSTCNLFLTLPRCRRHPQPSLTVIRSTPPSACDRPCRRFSSWTSWDVPSASDSCSAAERFNRLPLPQCAAVNKSIRWLSHRLNSSIGTIWLTLTSSRADEENQIGPQAKPTECEWHAGLQLDKIIISCAFASAMIHTLQRLDRLNAPIYGRNVTSNLPCRQVSHDLDQLISEFIFALTEIHSSAPPL